MHEKLISELSLKVDELNFEVTMIAYVPTVHTVSFGVVLTSTSNCEYSAFIAIKSTSYQRLTKKNYYFELTHGLHQRGFLENAVVLYCRFYISDTKNIKYRVNMILVGR